MSQEGVANYHEGVRQLLNVLAHITKANHLLHSLCQGNLLGLEHETKLTFISRSGRWAEKLYKSIQHKGSVECGRQVLVGVLAASEQDYAQALEALAGPHVSIIAAIKYNAHVITTSKSAKRGESTNTVLNNALRAVNCVNAIWYSMTHLCDFLWDIARFIPQEHPARDKLMQLRKRIAAAVTKADEFSNSARLTVAEECITKRLVVPASKAFRGVVPDTVLGAGPVVRSEVVFKHKCKTLSKVSKHQPLRLSIFGKIVVLTISKLSAETLAVPPCHLASVSAEILPSLPDSVFRLKLGPKTQLTLRCKLASHRDTWVNFFNENSTETVDQLLQKHETFTEQIAAPAPPRLAQRPSMAELSLFNEQRKTNSPAPQAWGSLGDDALEEDDDDEEEQGVEPQFKPLTDILDQSSGRDSSLGQDVTGHCSLPASRSASPMPRADRYTPSVGTAASRTASPLCGRHSPAPVRMGVASPSPLRAGRVGPQRVTAVRGDAPAPRRVSPMAPAAQRCAQQEKEEQKEKGESKGEVQVAGPAFSTASDASATSATSSLSSPSPASSWQPFGQAKEQRAAVPDKGTGTDSPLGDTDPWLSPIVADTEAITTFSSKKSDAPTTVLRPSSASSASSQRSGESEDVSGNTRPAPNTTADTAAAKQQQADQGVVTVCRVMPAQAIRRKNSDAFASTNV